jgi:hypothetical protein
VGVAVDVQAADPALGRQDARGLMHADAHGAAERASEALAQPVAARSIGAVALDPPPAVSAPALERDPDPGRGGRDAAEDRRALPRAHVERAVVDLDAGLGCGRGRF